MPLICPVCSKQKYSYQDVIECTRCNGWVHHGNRLECSGLTDVEYLEHVNDEYKPFQCDHCTNEIIAKANNSVFCRFLFQLNVKIIHLVSPFLNLSQIFLP